MTYKNYNSITKQLYCTNHLHINHVRKIPASTRFGWRLKYKNNPLTYDPQQAISNTIENLKSTISILMNTLPKNKSKKTFWKKHLQKLTETINDCNAHADKMQILQLLNITPQAFTKWINPTKCNYSLVNLCPKKYPNQLREHEKSIIKNYMQNPQHQFYNRSQVYWIMRNDKALFINKKTFHKYCDIMNLHNKKQKKEGKRKCKGITATKFLEKIHIDITYLGLLNHSTAYILNIADNHTRCLLQSTATLKCNSQFVSQQLEKLIIQYKLNDLHTEIIADGGSENKGKVETMLKKYPNIKLTITIRDTPHLNNIVEACHKRLKNNVLPHNFFTDIIHLQNQLPHYQNIYNHLPQNHLQGLTPNDAINGIVFDAEQNKTLTKQALQERKNANRNMLCCKVLNTEITQTESNNQLLEQTQQIVNSEKLE
jgi:hypothetical protein